MAQYAIVCDIDYFENPYTPGSLRRVAGLESVGSEMSGTAHAQVDRETFCQYCGGRLHLGYHFECHICGDAYCYIHMARHSRAHSLGRLPQQVYAQ